MNGTVVAMDPDSGRILAMVNQKLALSAGAQPCSTIKVAVALAALSENVITKEDRRLGDYFTDSIDHRGCLIIATGDTTLLDPITHMPSPTSHPLFLRQNGGTGLFGKPCGQTTRASRKPRHGRGFTG